MFDPLCPDLILRYYPPPDLAVDKEEPAVTGAKCGAGGVPGADAAPEPVPPPPNEPDAR